jgi:hypothetical protein
VPAHDLQARGAFADLEQQFVEAQQSAIAAHGGVLGCPWCSHAATGITPIGPGGGARNDLKPRTLRAFEVPDMHRGAAVRRERSGEGGQRKSSGPGRYCPEPPSEPEGAVKGSHPLNVRRDEKLTNPERRPRGAQNPRPERCNWRRADDGRPVRLAGAQAAHGWE